MQSLTWGEMPADAEIVAACDGPYEIRGLTDAIIAAVNQGIDAHLTAIFFTEVHGDRWNRSGIDVEPESVPVLIRRLRDMAWAGEELSEEAGDDASTIMHTLGWEWI